MNYKELFEQNLDSIKELLSINSVYDANSVSIEAPFGKGAKDALLFMKEKAIKDGFIVKEYDNEVISVSYVTNDSKHIDIAAHVDVVPVDDNWTLDPFKPTIIDNRIYGRGTCDMKMPLYLIYIALKMLREKYPNAKKEIRLLIGTDEERTMQDMRHYYAKASEPLFAFTPDGTFPMNIGELGALMWSIEDKYEGIIEELKGGISCNVVAPNCYVRLKNNEYTSKIKEYTFINNIEAKIYEQDNKTIIETTGKAVHSSISFFGENAIIKALAIINDVCEDSMIKNIYDVFSDSLGSGFDSKIRGEYNTLLTSNLGILNIENNRITGQVDCRYPNNVDSKTLTDRLMNKLNYHVSLDYDDKPTLCDINDRYVRCLLNTYREVSGDKNEPIVAGGVSYSKVFKHCVCFGINKLTKPMKAHEADEYIEIEDCIEALEVYYKAIEKLLLMED